MMRHFILFLVVVHSCNTDDDCSSQHICSDGNCEEKNLFPLTTNEIIGTCLIFLISGLANSGGIGGGILFVICFIILFNYNTSDAVALSQCTIFGGTFAAVSIKIFQRHPTKNKPVIDYDMILLILSPLLLGTSIGVILNIIMPYFYIFLILTILLVILTIKTTKSSIHQYKKETSEMHHPVLVQNHEEIFLTDELIKIYNEEKKNLPWSVAWKILLILIFVIVCSFIRGSRTMKSIVNLGYCSSGFWIASALIILFLLFIYKLCLIEILKKYEYKVAKGYEFDISDMKWNKHNSYTLSFTAFMAGWIGSLVGIGGALILSPVLIANKIRPEVMTATTSFMIIFASIISSLQYIIAGKVNLSFAYWTIIFALLGSAFGITILKRLVAKYNRSSFITITLALTLGISSIVSILYGALYAISKDDNFKFHNYCK